MSVGREGTLSHFHILELFLQMLDLLLLPEKMILNVLLEPAAVEPGGVPTSTSAVEGFIDGPLFVGLLCIKFGFLAPIVGGSEHMVLLLTDVVVDVLDAHQHLPVGTQLLLLAQDVGLGGLHRGHDR